MDTSTPLSRAYGSTYTDMATSISIPIIGTFTPRELLATGLVTKGGQWDHVRFDAMLRAVPGVIAGKLMGPRDLMFARQEAGKRTRPGLWRAEDHNPNPKPREEPP